MVDLRVGQIVGDRYRIDALIGSGGMGAVVSATHVELGQRVAIKFLLDVRSQTVARFEREGRLLVQLKSPHVARVFDVGVMDDDTPYIVMEHLEGQDLADLVGAVGRVPYEEVVDYVLQASDAIAEAHALGIVHRDLKPANVFLAKDRRGVRTVKVLDFGISKLIHGADGAPTSSDLTSEGVAIGSAGYMAPEQIDNARDVDVRADVYSLGALMYALVAATPPHKGDSPFAILAEMTSKPLTPLRSWVPEVPADFAAVVERCLAVAPGARWPTVAHLARALAPFATARGKLYVKQICATLGTEPAKTVESVDTVALPAPQGAPPHRSVPPGPEATLASHEAHLTVPPFAPSASPSTFVSGTTGTTARRRASTLALTLAGGLGVIAVIFAGTAWRTFKSARGTSDETVQPYKAPPPPAVTEPSPPAFVATAPSPSGAPPAVDPGETTAAPVSSEHATKPGKPRATPPQPRGTPNAPLDPSRPPNPSSMPASRR